MKTAEVTLPEMALIAGTRAMLGAGLGFLLADRFNLNQRKAIGWTLVMVGAMGLVAALEWLGQPYRLTRIDLFGEVRSEP
ncbi:MAG: hypothetical protein EPO39_07120, partial [Candidatus Manganitrophaceae bacterium]